MTAPELRDYQEVARTWLRVRDRAGLFLDMGLGKTAVVLRALEERHLPALVVAPKKVAENTWPTEHRLWAPELRLSVAKGGPAARAEKLAADADLYVIGVENLADALQHRRRYRTLVIDESSLFKNRNTARWKVAHQLAKTIPGVWALTGTPAPQSLIDLWAQLFLLDHGERLYPQLTRYRRTWFTPGWQLPNGAITSWDLRPGAEDAIYERIEDICMGMRSDTRIELPEVTINHVPVKLPAAARRVYDRMKAARVADLKELGLWEGKFSASSAAALGNRLTQITAGFLYDDDDNTRWTELHRAKAEAVREIVEAADSPVLVFYRYRAELEMLQDELGELAHTPREDGFVDRWNAGEIPVLLAHPASAGHGLNLQYGGHTMVWTSLSWSSEQWEQANKRLARPGQSRPVVIHVLEVPNTHDRVVEDALQNKISVQDALLDYLESVI